jgi:hypothetical protein
VSVNNTNFGPAVLVAKSVAGLCVPAFQRCHSDANANAETDTHAKGAPKFVANNHTVFDQFGSLQLTVKSPYSLIVRAGKTVLGTTFAKCSLIRTARRGWLDRRCAARPSVVASGARLGG